LAACFSPVFLTLCIYHLPLPYATRIFECFLIEGETLLIRLVLNLVQISLGKILTLHEHELLDFLRSGMLIEAAEIYGIDAVLEGL
jgi:hypothetical protein